MTLQKKIEILLNMIRDVPWRCHDLYDSVIPNSDFRKLYNFVRPYSMLGPARLRALYEAVRYVISKGIPGDIVECGTAKGGSAALMGLTMDQYKDRRTLWIFDTFTGLPSPSEEDPDFEIAKHFTGQCKGELEEVQRLFTCCSILDFSRFVPGLFHDTLPATEVEKISILHIDGDWYESVMDCLVNLYDRVTPGGIIQIDDYGHWMGAKRAVDDFFQKSGIDARLKYIDYTGRQFYKPY